MEEIFVWLSKHAFTLVIIAGVIAQLMKAMRGQKGTDDAPPPPVEDKPFADPELAERTRRIREDIQRKIAERQRGRLDRQPEPQPAPVSYEAPPPLVREVVIERAPEPARATAARIDLQRQAEILERQNAIAEQLRELETMKAAAVRRSEFERQIADTQTESKVAARGALLDDLRESTALRRAFVLREVLGPPVALR
jgi:hypothetical protein